jgi:hypothetical protein
MSDIIALLDQVLNSKEHEFNMVNGKKQFVVKKEHLLLIKRMYVYHDNSAYEGAPCVNFKRPYGNSDIFDDIAEIVGIQRGEDEGGFPLDFTEEQIKLMKKLHEETAIAIQIAFRVGYFKPGLYEAGKYDENWIKVKRTK